MRDRNTDGDHERGPTKASSAKDVQLVRQAARGDRSAQQDLLTKHIARIRARVARLAGGSSEAQDLVQTACMELLRSLGGYRGDACLEFWIDRVTTHVVLKHFRSTSRRSRRISLVASVDREHEQHAERIVQWRRGAEAARTLVDQIEPKRRMVFLLVAVEGRTLPETATLLGISVPAAKSRYLRARHEVDQRLTEDPCLRGLLQRSEGDDG